MKAFDGNGRWEAVSLLCGAWLVVLSCSKSPLTRQPGTSPERVRGVLIHRFEGNEFLPCGSGDVWWWEKENLQSSEGEEIDSVLEAQPLCATAASMKWLDCAAYVDVSGKLQKEKVPPFGYGNGSYSRELSIEQVHTFQKQIPPACRPELFPQR